MPAPSKNQHVLATLRQVLNLGQKELATLTGCSKSAIQRIELGLLKLSDFLARQISDETGVELVWLLAGAHNQPPLGFNGLPLTREGFERHRVWREGKVATDAQMAKFHAWARGCTIGLAGPRVPTDQRIQRVANADKMVWTLAVTRKGKPVAVPPEFDAPAIARRLMQATQTVHLRAQAGALIEQFNGLARGALAHRDGELILWRLKRELERIQRLHGLVPAPELPPPNGLP